MGFNTVAFLLNDFMHELEKSPRTVAFALAHPPQHGAAAQAHWRTMVESVAADYGEPVPHSQALEMLPTWHADGHKFIVAGGNCVDELKVDRFYKSKDGRRLVTLELPSWWR
jgi:hypothetical protein